MNFRFLNIPVQIHPSFWIFLIFFTDLYRDLSMESVILGIVLIFSLLVHEYGHALTALYFGARPEITLEAFGGNAQYNSFGMTSRQMFFITLNGPLLESTLIFLSYSLLKSAIFAHHPYLQYFLYATLRLNILWVLFNLIPIAPLDGGHLAQYFLERKFGSTGYKASLMIGLAAVALIAPFLFLRGYFFFGILLLIYGYQSFKILRQEKVTAGGDNHFSNYIRGVEAIKNNDLENAKKIFKKLLKAKETGIRSSATESLAKIYLEEKQDQKSYDLLLKADPDFLKEGKLLLCKLAFQRKNYKLASKYSRDIYEYEPSYETALMNSQTFAYLNDPALSGAWLEIAFRFKPEGKEVLDDALYNTVRNHDEFRKRLRGYLQSPIG